MHINYRPDIDGLRAIAVLLVIFNHLGWTFFSGGYIGVDIFFVISGFLITSIVFSDIQKNKFSISNFYKKRVIRLAPAYFTVLAIVSVISYFVLLPQELELYAKSLIYSTFFMANIYMQKEVGDYFSGSVDQTPLLHLWSLGVEEQFYILWPLVLLFLFRNISIKLLVWVVLSLIVLSVFNAEQALYKNAARAYYSMPVRAFELLLGALICFIPAFSIKRIWATIGGWGSLCVIFICAIFYDKKIRFPGLYAIFPCLAAVFIIYLGQGGKYGNSILKHPISVYIGKLSYPMYLWHWPIIVWFNLHMWPLTVINKFIIAILTLFLSLLTYHGIEKPCRALARISAKKVILVGFLIPTGVVSSMAAFTIQQKGFLNWFPSEIQRQVGILNSFAHKIRNHCHNYPSPDMLPQPDQCILGVKKQKIDFMMIGDSHANHFTGMVNVWAKDAELRGYDATWDLTAYLPNVKLFTSKNGEFRLLKEFIPRNKAITQHLKTHHYQFVMLAGNFNTYFDQKLEMNTSKQTDLVYLQGMRNALNNIYASGAKAVLLMDNPNIKDMQASCPVRATTLGLQQKVCHISYASFQQDRTKFLQMLQKLKQEYPKLIVIDPTRVICDQTYCELALNNVPLYRDKDNNHLNYLGSQEIGKVYLQKFGNPLLVIH